MDKTEIVGEVNKIESETKDWFQSKTIVLALGLAVFNVFVLALTYIKPVFESSNSEAPKPFISLGFVLSLNVVFCLGIAYMRYVADKKIA